MSSKAFIDEWIRGKTADDFELAEHKNGRILWPSKLMRLQKDRTWKEVPIYVQVPEPSDDYEALADAKRIAREQNIDRKEDPDDWNSLLELCKVARAIREPKPGADGVHAQLQTVDVYLNPSVGSGTGISTKELFRIAEQVNFFAKLEDPRLQEVDERTAIAMALTINEVRSLSPLVGIAGSGLDSFVLSICVTLSRYLLNEHSQPSAGTSTAAS